MYKEATGEVPRGCEELFQTEVRLAARCGCFQRNRLQENWEEGLLVREDADEVGLTQLLNAVKLNETQ